MLPDVAEKQMDQLEENTSDPWLAVADIWHHGVLGLFETAGLLHDDGMYYVLKY